MDDPTVDFDKGAIRWLARDPSGAVIGSANEHDRERLVVALREHGRPGVFVKVCREPASYEQELYALQTLQATGAVPRLLAHDAGGLVLAIEHVGHTLDRLDHAAWPPLASVASTLGQIHAAGWVHGDAQAKNCAVDASGRVRWLDLELAARVDDPRRDPWRTPARDRRTIAGFYV